MDHLARLQEWYAAQCNGDWEHSYGVTIDTLDNPGWTIQIDLVDTELEEKSFDAIHRGDSENGLPWLQCKVASGKFKAAGDPASLNIMLDEFLRWAGH